MSGPPFDWAQDEPHPWLFDFDVETVEWPWPDSVYDACSFGCDRGAVRWGESFWMTCPVCDGWGIGKEHGC